MTAVNPPNIFRAYIRRHKQPKTPRTMIALNVSDEGSKIVTSTPTTAKGKATKIDTKDRQPSVTLLSGNGTAEVAVNEAGQLETTVHHGTVAEGEDFEVSTFELSADADNDAGEDRAITETIVSTTTRAEATSLNSTVGEEIPDA